MDGFYSGTFGALASVIGKVSNNRLSAMYLPYGM
jgi:hypothetical protein